MRRGKLLIDWSQTPIINDGMRAQPRAHLGHVRALEAQSDQHFRVHPMGLESKLGGGGFYYGGPAYGGGGIGVVLVVLLVLYLLGVFRST
jgi:hypothetical protein